MNDFQTRYLAEAGRRIQYEGFIVCPEKDGLLSVEWLGHRVCNVNRSGGMTYDPEHIRRNGLEDALDRVREIVNEALTYMRQMETAPQLTASGLTGDYRLLAEFNHIVLAGHAREGGYGVEFITWERIQNNTGLWQGHYYDNNYAAAKQDFTVRSGLLPSSQLFTKEQLAVIYDAAQNMTALGLASSPQQCKLLEGIMEQMGEKQLGLTEAGLQKLKGTAGPAADAAAKMRQPLEDQTLNQGMTMGGMA